MDAYEMLGTIGEGTYGVVLKARHKESRQVLEEELTCVILMSQMRATHGLQRY